MIKINLLPPELQGKKGRAKVRMAAFGGVSPAVGTALMAAVLVVFLAAWIIVGYGLIWSPISKAEAKESAMKAEYDKQEKELKKKKADHEERFAKWKRMQDQKEILQELKPANRLLWSEKLNMLVNLVPQDVYITGVEVTEKVDLVETANSKEARAAYTKKKKESETAVLDEKQKAAKVRALGAEPKIVQKPVISQTLIIKAATLIREDGSDRIAKVSEFERNMQQYEMKNAKGEVRRFKDFFEKTQDDEQKLAVNMGLMEQKLLDGVFVWAFEFTLNTEKPKPPVTATKTEEKPAAPGRARPAARPAR
jgi:Tfp pilus assembly protein PilN